jgi:hypothetical protein
MNETIIAATACKKAIPEDSALSLAEIAYKRSLENRLEFSLACRDLMM